jgi:hypothetical protein
MWNPFNPYAMKATTVYRNTIQFCWLKLLVGVLHVIVAAILFAVLAGLAALFGSKGVGAVMLLIWLSLLGIINFLFRHYLGYMLKAGHVAVIARTFRDGKTPDAPFRTGVQMVKQRFATANVYFVIDKLVAAAVKQLQNAFGRITGLFSGIPGMDALSKLGKMFIDISLGYVDECCLGYTFYNDAQNAYRSAADGVVIYAQNWKTLLKSAAVTMFVVLALFVAVAIVSGLLYAAAFRLFGFHAEGSGIAAFVLAIGTAYTVKYAFIDTWILVKMMSAYMTAVPATQITFDLYGKLRNLSSKFGELLRKADVQPASAPDVAPSVQPLPPSGTIACPQCGASLAAGVRFCNRCGTAVSATT